MKLHSLGMSDVKITPIIMGTWQAGKRMWAGIDDAEITKAIRAAFDSGITTFDTAEEYGWGHSERILGKALSDVRHQVVYATKIFPNHLKYDQVIERCHRSLKNLNTHYIDLYQIHWPAGSWGTKVVPIQETMRAMNELLQQGKIRAIGVSNFSYSQLEEAAQFARVDSLQPPYSLFWRHVEKDAMPYCIENNITILAYSSMAQGILTGKFGPGHKFAKGDHRSKHKLFKRENFKRVQHALNRLRPIADRYDFTLGQLALAWVVAHKGVCAIAGARNAEQVLQNAKAAEGHISDTELKEMDTISRSVTDCLNADPVMWEF
ncbi:MAG: aldo/keto reductase [Desulfobacteraceae bacterium 4484_190.2]|nr:MAG: aldo/keto reductase [Desulfobacteraceae bacterium 4484_190.2]